MRHPFINNGPLLFSLTVLLLLAASLVYGSTIEDTTLSHQQQRILRGEVKTKEVIHPRIQDNNEEITQGYFTTYQATTALKCPTTLSNVITINDESQLYYSIVQSSAGGTNGILCGRLEVTNNNGGWVGLAISQNGKMFGSEAIIGVPNDTLSIDGSGATVKKYYLGGYTVGYEVGGWGVYYMDEEKQTLTDTSLTEEVNEDGNDVTIMTFTKILNEDNEIPIVTNGTNIFLHARGIGQSSLGPHAGYGNVFEKDFSEDVTETPSAPTFSPGTVIRYFCTKDQAPLDRDEYCPWIEEDGYTDFESCDDKCGGKNKACVSTFCITETPTVSPTVSEEPTITPLPTTSDPSSSPSSSPVTPVPTVKGLAFIGGGTTTAYPTEPKFTFKPPERELSVPLSKFQLDFVVADPEKDSSSSNNNTKRRQLLRVGGEVAGTTITSRQLENDDEEYVFQSTQDDELLTLVSDHLLDQFTLNVDGTPSIVELRIDTKSQQDMGSGKVMVSYNYVGYAVYPNSKEAPSTAELDNEVLNSFNTRQGKGAFASSLQYTEDPLLKSIVNVIASSSASTDEASNPSKVINDKADAGGVVDNNTGGNSSTAIAVPIVVLIASIFAIVLIFTLRKYYIRYLENNANNDYVNYQNRKRKKKIKSGKKVKKKYDYFDSENGSDMSQSEDPIYTDLEIVGGDTFPMSQDSSDADPRSPVAQFNPNDTALPYDEEAQDVSDTAAVYDMTHFAHESYQMEEKVDEETLAGLYSDKDSYFQGSSTLASGQHHQQGNQHGDGDSVHSLDTLDSNTFGFQSHLIEDIDKIIQKNEQELKQEKDGPVKEEELDKFITEFTGEKSGVLETSFASSTAEMRHIGEVVLEENSDDTDGPVISIDGVISPSDAYEEEEEEEEQCGDIISIDGVIAYGSDDDSDEDEDENENIISIDGIITRRSDTDEEESVMLAEVKENDSQEDDEQNTSGESSTSATDQLFARIAELETKIMNTESQLSQDDSVHLISPPSSSLTSPMLKEETSTFPKGMFTDQTLSMIEQSRLAGTPPPSEGEVDNEMITQAKNNTLLGRYLGESESEDDSVFEVL